MRIDRDEWGLQIAEVTALRGTCLRRRVGCVLVDAEGRVLSTGYNGVPRGVPHCNDVVRVPIHGEEYTRSGWMDDPDRKGKRRYETWTQRDCIGWKDTTPHACPGSDAASGTNLDACMATHAEVNAIAQCRDVDRIHTCYTTAEPCISCTKMLMNTGCRRVIYREPYPHKSAELWLSRGIANLDSDYTWMLLPKGE